MPGDGADGGEGQGLAALGGAAAQRVGAEGEFAVPLDEAGEAGVTGADSAVEAVGEGAGGGGRKELDGADAEAVEVGHAAGGVPDSDAVVEVGGLEASEVEDRAAFEGDAHVSADGFDAREVAESGHEEAVEVDGGLAFEDFEAEEFDGVALLGELGGGDVGGPWIFLFGAVEVVAPEGLLAATETDAALIPGAVNGGDAGVEEAGVGGDGFGFGGVGGLGGGGLAERPEAGEDGQQKDDGSGEDGEGDGGFLHRRLSGGGADRVLSSTLSCQVRFTPESGSHPGA